MTMTLTTKQDLLIENLGELLIYGNENISKAEMHPFKIRPKKYILFCAMSAAQSYSEAILKLMKPENIYDKAAEVLLRSLVETYINLTYVYSSKTSDNAFVFIVDSIKDKINFAEKHQTLWEKYPKWKLEFGTIKESSGWDKFIKEQEENITQAEKKNKKPIISLPGLVDRAIVFDTQYVKRRKSGVSKRIAIKRLERKSLEKYYVLYYKYFSQLAHLTMPGLEQFMRIDGSGRTWIDIDGLPSSIERVVPITFVIYLSILNHFLKQFNIYDNTSFQRFKDVLKSIK